MSTGERTILCERCKGAAGCNLPKNPGMTSCEAFEAFEYFVPAILDGRIKTEGWTDSARSMGLCGDCANRDTCMYVRREGGTWHCEEYC